MTPPTCTPARRPHGRSPRRSSAPASRSRSTSWSSSRGSRRRRTAIHRPTPAHARSAARRDTAPIGVVYDGRVAAIRLELRLSHQSEWIKIFDPRDWTIFVPTGDAVAHSTDVRIDLDVGGWLVAPRGTLAGRRHPPAGG